MGKLYVSEYIGVNEGSPYEPSAVDQVITYGASTQTAAFAATTTLVRVHTDSICSIKFGKDPTATTSEKRLAAGQTEYFAVSPGHKIAAITNT